MIMQGSTESFITAPNSCYVVFTPDSNQKAALGKLPSMLPEVIANSNGNGSRECSIIICFQGTCLSPRNTQIRTDVLDGSFLSIEY